MAEAPFAWLWCLLLTGLLGLSLVGRWSLARQGRAWPWWRAPLWAAGVGMACIATLGPMPAGSDFSAHMLSHLLLGMLAPLLLALSAPVTLALRALPTAHARRLARALNVRPLWLLAHPITAALLDLGGLWLLYATPIYREIHRHAGLGLLVHLHMLAAGYLFAAAIVGIDPVRHRPGWTTRAAILLLATAAHAILAKWLYAHPPAGIPPDQAHAASRLMFYGGDAIEGLLMLVFCWRWYRATAPRIRSGARAGHAAAGAPSPAPISAVP